LGWQRILLIARNAKVMTGVLGIVYRTIATYLAHKAGFAKTLALTGAVTLIQRIASALNLNIHFHMLFLDGVYVDAMHGGAYWSAIPATSISPRRPWKPQMKTRQISYWKAPLLTALP